MSDAEEIRAAMIAIRDFGAEIRVDGDGETRIISAETRDAEKHTTPGQRFVEQLCVSDDDGQILDDDTDALAIRLMLATHEFDVRSSPSINNTDN